MNEPELYFPSPRINRHLKFLLLLESLLLLAAYCLITYNYRQAELQKTERTIRQMNYSLMNTIQHSANSLDTLTKAPIGNNSVSSTESLWNCLTTPGKIEENPALFDSLFFDKYYQLNLLFPDLNAFFLYEPTNTILAYKYNDTYVHLIQDMPSSLLEYVVRQENGAVYYFTKEEIEKLGYATQKNVLFAGRLLNNLVSTKPAAIAVVGVDINDITLTFERHKLFESQEFACFDSTGKMLFFSGNLGNLTWEQVQENKDISKGDVYYQVLHDDKHGLYSVVATDTSAITVYSTQMKWALFVFLPLVLLSTLFLSLHIIHNVINSYSRMTEKIYRQSIAEKDLNFQMLRSQINPHFLYNTLDSMRMSSLKAGYTHLASMCEILAKILRYGVSDTKNLVTVKEELDHLNEYIELLRLRYSNLDVQTYIDPSIMEIQILKLLLQPLVENSVNHGLADDSSKGSIYVWGYQNENMLIFTVTDNGNGMNPEQLELLRDYLEDKNTAFRSIGLKNIKKRIRLYYGDDYDLTIDSRLYQGTSVTITLPVATDAVAQWGERNDGK